MAKVVRFCAVCESILGKLIPATHIASGTDYRGELLSWNECSNHGEWQNHLHLKRELIESFEDWFTSHGFDFNRSTGQSDFPATGKWKERPCRGIPFDISGSPKAENVDMWKLMGGTIRR